MSSPLITDSLNRPTWRYRVAPFRLAFQKSGLTISEVANRVGVDEAGMARALGLRAESPRGGTRKPLYRQTIGYTTAERIVKALGLDPVEWEV